MYTVIYTSMTQTRDQRKFNDASALGARFTNARLYKLRIKIGTRTTSARDARTVELASELNIPEGPEYNKTGSSSFLYYVRKTQRIRRRI